MGERTDDIVAVIPARGGSKRVPNKNIYPLLGKPLLAYTVEAVLESRVASRVVVSTDSDRIARVAVEYGADILRRPAEIAHDTASTESALLHALEALEVQGYVPGHVLTLPPTSPLRTARTIRSFVDAYRAVSDRYDAMFSLHENRGDFWVREEEGCFRRLFPDAPRRRQAREPLYEENSALYLTQAQALIQTGFILGRRMTGFVIDPVEAIDINAPEDLLLAELHLRLHQEARRIGHRE